MKNHNMHDLSETLAKKNVAYCQFNSAIYDGQIRHRRFAPRENKFIYQLHMLALDVDEVAFDGKNNLIAQGPFGYAWFYPMRFVLFQLLLVDFVLAFCFLLPCRQLLFVLFLIFQFSGNST